MPSTKLEIDLKVKETLRANAMVEVAHSYKAVSAAVATLTKNEKEQKSAIDKLVSGVNWEVRNIVLYDNMGLDNDRDLILELLQLIRKTNYMVADALVVGASIHKKENARKGANAKLTNDTNGKQKEKTFIRECWNEWQNSPASYASQAAFARDMLSKCEHLTSQKKIEDWCREWKQSTSPI